MAKNRTTTSRLHRLKKALCLLAPLLLAVFFLVQLQTLGVFSPVARCASQRAAVDGVLDRLRASVTFLPLRDPRRKRVGEWFISALNDSSEPEGEARNLVLPSAASSGRVFCVRAPPRSDAAYALAWRDALPRGAALRPGLTFVSEMSYDYRNLWHGISALVPFASWHARGGCAAAPVRWALFHNGAAVRTGASGWLASLAEATTGREMVLETFHDAAADGPAACFEEAVVFRRQMEGLTRERLLGAFDFMRCKARAHCGVADVDALRRDRSALRVTLLFRTGARAFKDEAAVARVFDKECARVAGCAVTAARTDNLTFCDQVKLLSATDVLITPHGAQLTNLLFMERNSSIMEFYPLGWRQRAGGGQFVYRWMADRAGMRHEGSWWDPNGEPCPGSPDILSCFKNRQIGLDEAYFAQWASKVFAAAKERKMGGAVGAPQEQEERRRQASACGCKSAAS
ncbi:hypothetical protein BS78_07G147300 [Paspalum vaginatum]|nr:hypothetical protein BS78_07G147300 [Paspalum vaginatum]